MKKEDITRDLLKLYKAMLIFLYKERSTYNINDIMYKYLDHRIKDYKIFITDLVCILEGRQPKPRKYKNEQ